MNAEQLISAVLRMIQTQVDLPDHLWWAPTAVAGMTLLIGLITIWRGARWARGSMSSGLALIGGVGGYFLAVQIATPVWITTLIGGVVGAAVGVLFFRLWQALLLGGVAAGAALGAFAVFSLTPAIQSWTDGQPVDGIHATLKPAGTVVGEHQPTVAEQARSLWQHLNTTVPNFAMKFWGVLLSSGLAGLVFGLLLPRTSRALWVATIGTMLLGSGAAGIMNAYAPDALAWLGQQPMWSWGIVGATWLIAFVYALRSTRPRSRASADESEQPAKPAIA